MPAPRDDDAETPPTRETASRQQVHRPAVITVVVVFALVVGALLGRWSTSSQEMATPSTSGVDAGFARDMSAHHAQAVEVAMIVHAEATTTEVRTLVYDIATSQGNQRGQMMGWLQLWRLPLAVSGERMAWMHTSRHEHAGAADASGSGASNILLPDGRMPGMASDAQLQKLRAASGERQGRRGAVSPAHDHAPPGGRRDGAGRRGAGRATCRRAPGGVDGGEFDE